MGNWGKNVVPIFHQHKKHGGESKIQSAGRESVGYEMSGSEEKCFLRCHLSHPEHTPVSYSPTSPLPSKYHQCLGKPAQTVQKSPSINNVGLWTIRNQDAHQLSSSHFGFFSTLHLCPRRGVLSVQNTQWYAHSFTIFLHPQHRPSRAQYVFQTCFIYTLSSKIRSLFCHPGITYIFRKQTIF